MKRIFAALFSFVLLVGAVGAWDAPVSAAEKETIVIAGSDFQVSNNNPNTVKKIINNLALHGITKVDCAFFCGDYTLEATASNQSQYGVQKLKDTFNELTGGNMLFVQGNHDIETTAGLSKAGNNDPKDRSYGAFIIHEDQYPEWGNNRTATEQVSKELRTYLAEKSSQGWKKPIFILSHIPLHWSNRTRKDGSGTDGALIFDVLNEYGEKGLNIIFLYGHNHSGGYDNFMGGAAVYLKKGDTIEVCKKSDAGVAGEERKKHHETRTLKFTYMNAGFIGYYAQGDEDTDVTPTMSVFRIRGEEVIITRYNGKSINLNTGELGIHNLKSKGTWSEYFYENNKYHIEDINTLEYASSRKVTATDDVPVDTPLPDMNATTTASKTAYITTSRTTALVVQKPTGTTTDGADATTTSGTEASTLQTTRSVVAENSVPSTTKAMKTTKADKDTKATAAATPWWLWLCAGVVALLLIGAVIAIVLLSRPIKPKV